MWEGGSEFMILSVVLYIYIFMCVYIPQRICIHNIDKSSIANVTRQSQGQTNSFTKYTKYVADRCSESPKRKCVIYNL